MSESPVATMSASTKDLYAQYVLGNYGQPSVTFVRGDGVHVWDDEGKRYLDFGSGIAVTALGHSHPHWVAAVQDQAAKLAHVSNLFANETQGLLAQKLIEKTGPGRMFFCNSGAEANEGLLKLARLYGQSIAGKEGQRYKVICAEQAFHGRTYGGMSATPQVKIQNGFAPLLDGFSFGKLNDLASFEALIDDQTAAIFIETIQGEGGIHPATPEFLQGLRKLCDEHGLLLMLDEVQCGAGRTGTFFAFEKAGIQPDAIGMAKGLGGGFPIGAIWIAEAYHKLFTPGSHGTTFGGNPLACAAALAVLDVMESDNLLAKVSENVEAWHARLNELPGKFPQLVAEIRGAGYMIGIGMKIAPLDVMVAAREAGLLVVAAGSNALRMLPPLIATPEDLSAAMDILEDVLGKTKTMA
ncbi:aspartate aminotransferase family protein [Rubellicoccus peritrichatus]|uniref:Acetylornithine aminotransferase n=1 Tax=Rubellicoccus peritrichatus TaxID=3080537 RepID=A0AAQ3LDU3_9BACT|nr:aspartate aminotransferase family protein [Puniceicoccus sp. CR14]WOO42085.1 aspartate aminotransferase family protein [Puniceicoccus sp. CR14]